MSKTYCTLPFIHSHASVNGTFKPCCNAETKDIVKAYGRARNTKNSDYTLQTWFAGPEMQQLREDLLNDVRNPMCGRCWRNEDRSGNSIRTRMNEKFAHLADPTKPEIKYLDLKLSNECNLQCRMCDQTQSHLINRDVDLINEAGLEMPTNWIDRPNWNMERLNKIDHRQYKELLRLIPHIKVLKVTGGEPTMQPEVLELLDHCIKNGSAKDMQLNITTNGTKFTRRFLDKISVFKDVFFNISVDGHGSTYEYIRYPFKWDKWCERQLELLQYKDHYRWGYTCVPQMYNIENLHKLQAYVHDELHSDLYMNNVLHPDGIYNSLDIVPNKILQYAVHHIKLNSESDILINYLNQLLNSKRSVSESRLRQMYSMVTAVDKVRKQRYNEYLDRRTVEFIEQSGATVV